MSPQQQGASCCSFGQAVGVCECFWDGMFPCPDYGLGRAAAAASNSGRATFAELARCGGLTDTTVADSQVVQTAL